MVIGTRHYCALDLQSNIQRHKRNGSRKRRIQEGGKKQRRSFDNRTNHRSGITRLDRVIQKIAVMVDRNKALSPSTASDPLLLPYLLSHRIHSCLASDLCTWIKRVDLSSFRYAIFHCSTTTSPNRQGRLSALDMSNSGHHGT
jgi:hypothetical protein